MFKHVPAPTNFKEDRDVGYASLSGSKFDQGAITPGSVQAASRLPEHVAQQDLARHVARERDEEVRRGLAEQHLSSAQEATVGKPPQVNINKIATELVLAQTRIAQLERALEDIKVQCAGNAQAAVPLPSFVGGSPCSTPGSAVQGLWQEERLRQYLLTMQQLTTDSLKSFQNRRQ